MSAFPTLAAEAVKDAARRRIVAVVALVSVLSLFLVESCTSCSSGQLVVEGRIREMVDLVGFTSSASVFVLGLWCIVLAGVLAAEHLAQALADGSATLCLARPVARGSFAAARLAGALAIAFATATLLLGGAAFFVQARAGLAPGPALMAGAAVAAGSVVVGALSMAASLFLPRIACVLLVFALVGTVALANVVGFFDDALRGTLGAVDRFGPPLATALALAVDPWISRVSVPAQPEEVALRLALWAVGSLALLWFAFRRVELGG